MKKKITFIVISLFLFTASRLLYIFFLNDADLLTDLKLIEGHYTGVIAQHLLEGLIMPFWDYQFSSYDGGTLISSLVIAPFFVLFGPTALSVSLYCLFNSSVIFLLWITFVYRYYGERLAWIFATVFIFAPPNHIKESLGTGGNHMEVNFFMILVIIYFFRIFYRPEDSLKRPQSKITRDFLWLGFWAGLGVYFCYSSAVLLLSAFLFWLTLDKRGIRKQNYLYLCLTFLLGISCIFPRLSLFDSSIKEDILVQWPFSNFADFFPRLAGALLNQLPELLWSKSPVHILAYFVFLISFVVMCFLNRSVLAKQFRAVVPSRDFKVRLNDTNKNNFFILFIVIYLLVYTLSNFNTYALPQSPLQLRYLWLLFPFIFLTTAIGIERLYFNPRGYKLAAGILIYFVLAGLSGLWTQLDFTDVRAKIDRRLRTPGYAYEMLGTVICYRYAQIPPKSLSLLNGVREEFIPAMYRGFGYEFSASEFSHLDEYNQRITNPVYKTELAKGFFLGQITKSFFKETDFDNAYFYDVLAVDACRDTNAFGRRFLQLVDSFAKTEKKGLYYGAGNVVAVQCGLSEPQEFTFLRGKSPDKAMAFVDGVRDGLRFNRSLTNL